MQEKKANYLVVIQSRLGSRSEILSEPRFEKGEEFETLIEALRWIEREARVGGWRDFTLTTIGDPLSGIPLEKQEAA